MTQIIGSIVALVTPMLENGEVDYPSLRKLVDWHIEEGTDCIGVVGTTGESPTVTPDEQIEIIRFCVEHAAGRIPIMAGCGANSTHEAISLAKRAAAVGADCQLQVVPYYNKPIQQGLLAHFQAIAHEVDLPMVLYNVPGRTVADMSVDTILRLAEIDSIVGVKEASGNIDKALQIISYAPSHFALYSGDDPTAVALILCGGHGNISVTANVAPRLMHEMCMAARAGEVKKALSIHKRLIPLNQALFIETNPIPVKWALSEMGVMQNHLRLPLTPLHPQHQDTVRRAMRNIDLL